MQHVISVSGGAPFWSSPKFRGVFFLFEATPWKGWRVLQNASWSSVQILLSAKKFLELQPGPEFSIWIPFPGQRCKEIELSASICKFSIEMGLFWVALGVQVVEKTSFVFPRQQGPGFLQSAFVWGCVKPSMRHSFCFSCERLPSSLLILPRVLPALEGVTCTSG